MCTYSYFEEYIQYTYAYSEPEDNLFSSACLESITQYRLCSKQSDVLQVKLVYHLL